MPGLILAAVTSDNVRGGYFWTFLFPMVLFIVAGAALYVVLFSRPHARVPARRILPAQGGVPEPGAARDAAVGRRPVRCARRRDRRVGGRAARGTAGSAGSGR